MGRTRLRSRLAAMCMLCMLCIGGLSLASCSAQGAVQYKPPFVPILFSIDTDGHISVQAQASVTTPIGEFSAQGGAGTKPSPPNGGFLVFIQRLLGGQASAAGYTVNEDDQEKIIMIDDSVILTFTGRDLTINATGHHKIVLTSPDAMPTPTATTASAPTISPSQGSTPTPTRVPVSLPTQVPVSVPTKAPPAPTPTQRSAQVQISALAYWQDTHVYANQGDHVIITYLSGQWSYSPYQPLSDANGPPEQYVCSDHDTYAHCLAVGVPVPDAVGGSLVGKIGSQLLNVRDRLDFVAGQSGDIVLAINDGYNSDNRGALTIEVQVNP